MNIKKRYYKYLDIIRIISCFAVFLYHLNILKGGYLAVCTFFVLSGYLSVKSAFRKEKFSFKDYYINRLLHIYIPLIIVVFLTLFSLNFLSNINWVSLKPETTSVLLGYNNFWQISANMDYFARHINSPFMHFWYIAILLQFEVIFPFIFLLFKKIGDKANKIIPIIILVLLTLISTIYFCFSSFNDPNITNVYYNSLTRVFSILFGLLLGFSSTYYESYIFKNKALSKIIFYLYLILLIVLFIFIDSSSNLFTLAMVITTIISCRLIEYGTLDTSINKFDKVFKNIANITYEVYLFQYPVIFIFQYIVLKDYFSIPLIIIITFILSIILHIALDLKKKKVYKFILLGIISIISLFGVYKYITEEDHTKEMNELRDQLGKNEEIMKKRQEEYTKKLEEEKENYEKTLKELENGTSNLGDVITNLSIVGVGDSVMLGAVSKLNEVFPNGYFDAKVSRTDYEANGILRTLSNNNILGNPVVIHLGTNGQCGNACRNEMMKTIGDRKVFWITVTNDYDVHVNKSIKEYANSHDNSYIIDWENISAGHTEYFAADKIHLTTDGINAYSKTIYDSIYNVYLEEYNKKKEELINNHNDQLKTKITFYGNDLLLNVSDYMKDSYDDADYIIDKDFNYDSLIEQIKKQKPNYNVVFVFDKTFILNNDQYKKITKLLNNNKIYVVKVNNYNISNNNIEIIDLYTNLSNNSDYLMIDNIHLTDKGNKKLNELLSEALNK